MRQGFPGHEPYEKAEKTLMDQINSGCAGSLSYTLCTGTAGSKISHGTGSC